jgi:hypothetical protein
MYVCMYVCMYLCMYNYETEDRLDTQSALPSSKNGNGRSYRELRQKQIQRVFYALVFFTLKNSQMKKDDGT